MDLSEDHDEETGDPVDYFVHEVDAATREGGSLREGDSVYF